MNNENVEKKSLLHKLYGGLHMSWPVVLLYAVFAAALTFAFLMLPVFKDTSFARMGVHLEAWFFFAIIVMAVFRSMLYAVASPMAALLASFILPSAMPMFKPSDMACNVASSP